MTPPRVRLGAIILAGLAGAGLLVVGAFFGPSPDASTDAGGSGSPAAARRSSTTPTRPPPTSTSTTTTVTVAPSPTTPPPSAPPPTAAPTEAGAPQEEAPLGIEPPPPPDGVEAAADPSTCTWDEADGGTLRASGTVTNTGNGDDTWLVSVDWNDDQGFLDSESDFYVAAVGRSVTWSLTDVGVEPPIGALTCQVSVE